MREIPTQASYRPRSMTFTNLPLLPLPLICSATPAGAWPRSGCGWTTDCRTILQFPEEYRPYDRSFDLNISYRRFWLCQSPGGEAWARCVCMHHLYQIASQFPADDMAGGCSLNIRVGLKIGQKGYCCHFSEFPTCFITLRLLRILSLAPLDDH